MKPLIYWNKNEDHEENQDIQNMGIAAEKDAREKSNQECMLYATEYQMLGDLIGHWYTGGWCA